MSIPKIKGFVPDKPDERDYIWDEVAGAAPSKMPDWRVGYDAETKYPLRDELQGSSLSCVAQGGTADIELSILKHTGKKIQLSQRDAYSQIHLPSGGASPRDFYKLAHKKGICEDRLMPTRPDGKWLTESFARSGKGRSQKTIENALKWRISAYYKIRSRNPDTLAQAIYENDGCGGGYLKAGKIGHFIFFRGYGIYNGYPALKIRDSYQPHIKWIYKKGRTFYLGRSPITLYSLWVSEPGADWTQEFMLKERIYYKGKQYIKDGGKYYHIPDEPWLHFFLDMGWVTKEMREVDKLDGSVVEMPEPEMSGECQKNIPECLVNWFKRLW